ncbi:MAG: 30S ribosome-binding factor RbfA [Bacteroidota bacterium]
MDSTRQNKIARLLQKDLSDIFQKESRDLFRGNLISVTVVRVTADLSLARVYVSIFPAKDKDEILRLINDKAKHIRHVLASRVKHQLRAVPNLEFHIDDSLDYAEKIDELLKK